MKEASRRFSFIGISRHRVGPVEWVETRPSARISVGSYRVGVLRDHSFHRSVSAKRKGIVWVVRGEKFDVWSREVPFV